MIRVDTRQLELAAKLVDPKVHKKAWRAALGEAVKEAKKIIVDEIVAEAEVAKKYVNRVIKTRVMGEPPVGVITISRRALPIVAFSYRDSKTSGVSVTIRKDRPPLHFRHGFRARVQSQQQAEQGISRLGIFQRTRHLPMSGPNVGNPKLKLTSKGVAGRLAIRQFYGPPVVEIAAVNEVIERTEKRIGESLNSNFVSLINAALEKTGGA